MDTDKKKEDLNRLRKEFNEIKDRIAELGQELSRLHNLAYEKKKKHNDLLIATQKQILLLSGKRICQECREAKNSEEFDFLFLGRMVCPGTYASGGYQIVNEIKYICADCRSELLWPSFHAGYQLRMPIKKEGGRFFVLSGGTFKPIEEVFKNPSFIEVIEDIPNCYVPDELLTICEKL